MMRSTLIATAALIAAPVAAQDHSAHAGHDPRTPPAPKEAHEYEAHEGSMGHGQSDRGPMSQGHMEHAPGAGHAGMRHGQPAPAVDAHAAHALPPAASTPPPRAFGGPDHAADAIYGAAAMAPSRADLAQMDNLPIGTVMLERLEARIGEGENLYLWDAQAWHGSDSDKLWLKSEGEGAFDGDVESAEIQALWSHAIGPWFDLQAGGRYDFEPGGRAHAVLGVQGLAPYMFEVDAAAFLSDKGDATARIEAEYDQRITQRLILQPRAELSLAAQDITELGIGAGISSIEAGLRLRYAFVREFAPYVGIGYEAKLGDTAEYARTAGEDTDRIALLIGVRAWF